MKVRYRRAYDERNICSLCGLHVDDSVEVISGEILRARYICPYCIENVEEQYADKWDEEGIEVELDNS